MDTGGDQLQKLSIIELERGKINLPLIHLPNGDQFVWFKDVAGNTIRLIKK